MQQRLVYRMEDAQHRGPFNTDFLTRDVERAERMWDDVPWIEISPFGGATSLDSTHPHHLDDVLHVSEDFDGYASDVYHKFPIPGYWLVGCKDLRQFYHWFPKPSLPDFDRCGMFLHVYSCPEDAIKEGRWQLMFDPKRSTLVEERRLGTHLSLAA
jgi:hypothetical protein